MKKLTALFAFAFFLLFVGWAITPVQADPPRPTHNHGGGSGITYTAQLTSTFDQDGAFEFGPVNVTPNAKENNLRFLADFTVTPHGGDKNVGAWVQVFNDCRALAPPMLPPNQIPANFPGDGAIDEAGGVFVTLTDIEVLDAMGNPFVGLTLSLIGNCFNTDGCTDDFIPAPGQMKEVELTRFWLTGHTVKGIKPKGHCNKEGRTPMLATHSTLKITAPPP